MACKSGRTDTGYDTTTQQAHDEHIMHLHHTPAPVLINGRGGEVMGGLTLKMKNSSMNMAPNGRIPAIRIL